MSTESESGDGDVEMIEDAPVIPEPALATILSFVGPETPWEESMADLMACFFQSQGSSVHSYVYVPNSSASGLCLARYKCEENHREYEKTMVPSTACVTGLDSQVVFISCHAKSRNALTSEPACLLLYDIDSVSVSGERQEEIPDALKIWSCSSYTHPGSNQTYTKPAGSISLSDVVQESHLVMLLCCHGNDVMQEYASEHHAQTNPDFVMFEKEVVQNISMNIFVAMFITSVDRSTVRAGGWLAFLHKNVSRVILWVKANGTTPRKFWNFLRNIIGCVVDCEDSRNFQIKGGGNVYVYEDDTRESVLEDLQALTLVVGGVRVKCTHTEDALKGMVRPLNHQSVECLLLQLRGLLRGA